MLESRLQESVGKVAALMPMPSLTKILVIKRVPVYAHWSLLVLSVVILIGALERPAETLTAWISFFGVMLLHECGHMIVAQRRGYYVDSIELYPIIGIARLQQPYDRYDATLIAWGGVAAQSVVAVPLVLFVSVFGYTRSDAVNLAMGIFGFYSLFVAAFNLIPVPPLDGATAWSIVPELFVRARLWFERKKRRRDNPGWRGR